VQVPDEEGVFDAEHWYVPAVVWVQVVAQVAWQFAWSFVVVTGFVHWYVSADFPGAPFISAQLAAPPQLAAQDAASGYVVKLSAKAKSGETESRATRTIFTAR
jgi:hypothetical protein